MTTESRSKLRQPEAGPAPDFNIEVAPDDIIPAEAIQGHESIASAPAFAMALFEGNAPMGYVGKTWAGWGILSDTKMALRAYTYGNKMYFAVPNENTYMSVSANGYMGFYGWAGASAFDWDNQGDHPPYLRSEYYDHNAMTNWSTSNGYLYFYEGSGYTKLTVKTVGI